MRDGWIRGDEAVRVDTGRLYATVTNIAIDIVRDMAKQKKSAQPEQRGKDPRRMPPKRVRVIQRRLSYGLLCSGKSEAQSWASAAF
jgi:hypothetical protein